MAVKRPLKLNEVYIIQEVLPPLDRQRFVGYRCKVMLQQADDHLPRHYLSVEATILGGPEAGHRYLLQGVRLRHDADQRAVCRCKAYPFPHHAGRGKCYADHPGPFFCGDCGAPCDWKALNQKVSACCEAQLYEDPELKRSYCEELE